jgi:hypothetical protein
VRPNCGQLGRTPYPSCEALKDENARLKKLLAEAMLDIAVLRDVIAKKW